MKTIRTAFLLFFAFATAAHAEDTVKPPEWFLGLWPALSSNTANIDIRPNGKIIDYTKTPKRRNLDAHDYRLIMLADNGNSVYAMIRYNFKPPFSPYVMMVKFELEEDTWLSNARERALDMRKKSVDCGLTFKGFADLSISAAKALIDGKCSIDKAMYGYDRTTYIRYIKR